ncbi:TRAPP I complex [Jaminaea rosea]|uniref:TRAPP I complex n=1 Tax=Jaminaea rosea TaxID=1569628 RepID=A0A316UX48_9BASI|nr:TRAPP I complex [Jaminaea rosea]PWN27695.1 TRAPP I complex [Jaminaea rosea]
MSATAKQFKAAGDDVWKNKTDKISSELFTMTYGSLVIQLIKDYQDYAEVNKQLDKMGYNIGVRLIEDFLARSNISRCSDFRETGEIVAKVGFKMFLNVTPAVVHHDGRSTASGTASSSSSANTNGSAATAAPALGGQEFSLILDENPLSEFVELPPDAREGGLWWSNVLVGVLRGALEMVQLQTAPYFVSDVLRGDEQTELRVRLVKFLDEEAPPADD